MRIAMARSEAVRRAAAGVEHEHLGVARNAIRRARALASRRARIRPPARRRRRSTRDSRSVAARIASSLTACASPLLSCSARRIRRSPSGPGTRRPLACVVGILPRRRLSSSPAWNARTIGAHPSACATTMCGMRDVLRQPAAVAHLGEHLPHADQPRAAAGRIDDVRRQRQPSCSASSMPIVFFPSMRYGSRSVETSK